MDARDSILNAFRELVGEEAFEQAMREYGVELEEVSEAPPAILLVNDNSEHFNPDLTNTEDDTIES